jgi:hypothetical protein
LHNNPDNPALDTYTPPHYDYAGGHAVSFDFAVTGEHEFKAHWERWPIQSNQLFVLNGQYMHLPEVDSWGTCLHSVVPPTFPSVGGVDHASRKRVMAYIQGSVRPPYTGGDYYPGMYNDEYAFEPPALSNFSLLRSFAEEWQAA